jgi:hypothetical protein
MKRKKENKILVIDLTSIEDEVETKSHLALQSKLNKHRTKRREELKENAEKFLESFDDPGVSVDKGSHRFKEHKLHNFQKIGKMANAINNQYADQLIEDQVAEIQFLHQALDVNHTHIPCGDSTEWANLPNGFKNHFLSSNFNQTEIS